MRYLTASRPAGGMLRLLRAVLDRRQTGVLELSLDSGTVSLYFLSGELYLSPDEADWLPELEDLSGLPTPGPDESGYHHEEVAALIASRMASWHLRSFSFRDGLERVPEELAGPFSTPRLAMDLVSQRREELNLEYLLGGREARVIATRRAEPTVEISKLGRSELALVYELHEPTSVATLLDRDRDRRDEILVALARLWVAGMISELGPEEASPAKSVRGDLDDFRSDFEARPLPKPQAYTKSLGDRLPPADPDAIWKGHFRLRCNPFSLTPDPSFLYLSVSHAEALAGLKLSLMEKRGLASMTGEVGTGKTTLLYSLLSTLDSGVETAYVNNPALPVDQILQAILADLGVHAHGSTRLELLNALNDFLVRCAERGVTVALVLDEAQVLSDEAFEEIRLLLNFENYDHKLLQIILVGQQELAIRLQSWRLRQLADRIAIRCQLKPLTSEDSRKYIEHRLAATGGSADLFTKQALRLIAKKCRGIPRRINVVCHNALLYAYGEGERKVSHKMASEAIRESLRSATPLTVWRYQRSRAPQLLPQTTTRVDRSGSSKSAK